MSQENLELAREVFDAVARQDLQRLIELTDPEVEWQSFFALWPSGRAAAARSGPLSVGREAVILGPDPVSTRP